LSEKAKHFDLKTQARICTLCPNMCRFLCPVSSAEKVETYTPRGKATLVTAVERGGGGAEAGGAEAGGVEWTAEAAAAFYHCAGCKVCLEWCPSNVDLPEVTAGLRERAATGGLAPEPVKTLAARLSRDRSLHRPAGELAAGLGRYRDLLHPGARVLYFAGCSTAALYPEVLGATLRLLEAAGTEAAMLEPEECCGLPLEVLGYRDEAAAFASRLAATVREGGFETVVSGCPMCTYVMKERYPALGVTLEADIRHIAEFLAEPSRAAALAGVPAGTGDDAGAGAPGPVTYHDPCYLGRYQKVYDAPRALLTGVAGLGLIEMERSRELASCCGGAPAMATAVPEAATTIAERRLEEARLIGVTRLVTACPHCLEMLRPAGGAARSSAGKEPAALDVLDLTEVLAARLGVAAGGRGSR
jgi:Fe-S oxidoreductase